MEEKKTIPRLSIQLNPEWVEIFPWMIPTGLLHYRNWVLGRLWIGYLGIVHRLPLIHKIMTLKVIFREQDTFKAAKAIWL